MSEASRDVVHDILSRLPAKTLLRLRCVCKAWKSIIDDPIFVKSHTKNQHSSSAILTRNRHGALFCLSLDSLNYAADEYEELDVIPLKQIIQCNIPRLSGLPSPSCNGLILIPHSNINKSWAIWNLKAKESNDDYYKSRCWRIIDFPGGDCVGGCGAFLDGALHWRSRDGMVALDLGREVHRLVAPPPPKCECWCWESLDALDGCLIWSYRNRNLVDLDAWVMKDYGTEEKSWTKLLYVKTEARSMKPVVAYLKSKGQVFLRRRGSELKWLDLEKKSWRDITISGILHSHSDEISFSQFCPGLVRLDNHKNRRGGVRRRREKACVSSGESPCKVKI